MKVAYVAAPFSGIDHWRVTLNIIEAKKIAMTIAWFNVMPMCPHGNSESFHGTKTADFWYEGTLELLKRCDAIVMHPNWYHSAGSVREHDYAKKAGMPIFYYDAKSGLSCTGFGDWADGNEKD